MNLTNAFSIKVLHVHVVSSKAKGLTVYTNYWELNPFASQLTMQVCILDTASCREYMVNSEP